MTAKSRHGSLAFLVLCAVLPILVFFGKPVGEAKQAETAKAASTSFVDSLKAGAALILDADITITDEELLAYAIELNGGREEVVEEEESTLVMANVNNTLNVRAEPNEEAEIVGKLYADCGGTILERGEDWTLLQSGNLTGWASNDYLLFDEEAQDLANEVGSYEVTSLTGGLRVRKEPSTECGVYGLLAEGEEIEGCEVLDGWVTVNYEGDIGYVSAEYVTVDFILAEGETMTEIAEREAAEAAAKKAAEEEAARRKQELTAQREAVEATYSEVELLAAIIQCEAGNQPYEGMVAVGAVVMNRVKSPAYPNTIAGVIYAPGQFTPARNGRLAKRLELGSKEQCMQAARAAINGETTVGDAMHFNTSHSGGVVIGNHIFW